MERRGRRVHCAGQQHVMWGRTADIGRRGGGAGGACRSTQLGRAGRFLPKAKLAAAAHGGQAPQEDQRRPWLSVPVRASSPSPLVAAWSRRDDDDDARDSWDWLLAGRQCWVGIGRRAGPASGTTATAPIELLAPVKRRAAPSSRFAARAAGAPHHTTSHLKTRPSFTWNGVVIQERSDPWGASAKAMQHYTSSLQLPTPSESISRSCKEQQLAARGEGEGGLLLTTDC
ncbi:hypothetical protein U9M48_026310 [Paspalum notatum var. saurae]|uniref:Uncharacterized protein n=1 Tax=Paspalum notatum var. saurae TaxID=547442 RepID=A0AAQ3TQN0_PASNO